MRPKVIHVLFTLVLFAALSAGMSASAWAQTYTDLHEFNNTTDPSYFDDAYLAQGRDGNLYSLSHFSNAVGFNGTVYNITLTGTPTVLTQMGSAQGEYPFGGVILGTDGNFYGTGSLSGSSNFGTVFKVTPAGTLTVLHNFTNGTDGQEPASPPVQGNDGNYYGITVGNNGQVASTFYKITAAGVFSTVHSLSNLEGAACNYLILGSDGSFYGACDYGGTLNRGTVMKITTAGVVTVLYNYDPTTNYGTGLPLVEGRDGNYYGVNYYGSTNNVGFIYQIKSNGTFTIIYTFTGGTDGGNPVDGLTLGTDGNLYGNTYYGGLAGGCSGAGCGVIFKVTTAGVYTVLYTPDNTQGAHPYSNLRLDTNGLFYGNMFSGGNFNAGVFYSLNTGLAPFASLVSSQGKVGAKIGILGQGFSSASVVKFKGVQAINVVPTGTTYLTATVPVGALTGAVTVTTGSTTLTTPNNFKVIPTLTSFTPSSGPIGTVVTINGSGLTQATKVTINGLVAAFTVVSDSKLTATVPTGATTGKIQVTTPGGAASSSTSFTVTPAITSFSPSTGTVGTLVTLTGTSFTGATSVTFNGTAAAFTVVSDSSVTATVPVGASSGVITVTTPSGSGSSATSFTVTAMFTSFSPASGPVGTLVTITGSGLTGTSKVTFNNVNAVFTVVSDSQVTATVPTGATTGKIKVKTPLGTVISATSFTVM